MRLNKVPFKIKIRKERISIEAFFGFEEFYYFHVALVCMLNYTIYVLFMLVILCLFPHFKVIVFEHSEHSRTAVSPSAQRKVKNVFFTR